MAKVKDEYITPNGEVRKVTNRVIDRCLTQDEMWKIFCDFSSAVKEKRYDSYAYQDYKRLQKAILNSPSDVIWIEYIPKDHMLVIDNGDTFNSVCVDGNSMGAYLFDVLDIEFDLWNNYNDVWGLQGTSSMKYPVPRNYEIAASENAVNSIKEDNKMKFNFDFGPVDSNIRMSPFGMAIKNAEGTYVSYNAADKQIVDVDVFNFSGSNFMMKMPVALSEVKPGDIVVHQRKPMFVTNIDGNILGVIDIYSGEAKGVVPTTNMFGFNFVTKVVSFLDMGTPSKENPFGNMWPLFMMGDGKMDKKQMFMFMIMMSQNKNAPSTLFQNPMFMLAFLQDGGMDDMMPMVMAMMMSQNQGHVCNCGGQCGQE